MVRVRPCRALNAHQLRWVGRDQVLQFVPGRCQPTIVIVVVQDDRHGLGVDGRHNSVRFSREKAIGIAALGRAPDACKREDWAAGHVKPVQRLLAVSAGANPYSEKAVTGTRQRRAGVVSIDRQKLEFRFRTFVTYFVSLTEGSRALGTCVGTPHSIRSSFRSTPSCTITLP